MRVLVCGGRDYFDYVTLARKLDEFSPTELIHGAARGADSLADRYAREKGIPVQRFHADWQAYGKAAGPIRNKQMLLDSDPDLVVAFPGGKGTANMITTAKSHHYRVEVVH